jgi:hypothetical protein
MHTENAAPLIVSVHSHRAIIGLDDKPVAGADDLIRMLSAAAIGRPVDWSIP